MTENTGRTANGAGNWRAALACVLAALPLAVVLRGFTVDDALVTARVASHLAAGAGHRFNPSGPEVDAVTPFGFAHLLALAGPATPLGMFERARWLGFGCALLAAAVLGFRLPRSRRALGVVLPVLALSAPFAAWASSGMETCVVALFVALSLLGGASGAFFAGLAAAWRPELLVFSVILAGGEAFLGPNSLPERARRLGVGLALVLAPALLVALLRKSQFGSAVPLAVIAKPSDLVSGLAYTANALVLGGVPLLLLAPRALRRADGHTRLLCVAVLAHFVAVAFAGGDWMALQRLFVPILPAGLLAGARLAECSHGIWLWLRAGAAVLASLTLLLLRGLPGRSVLEHRRALIAQAAPQLREARSIAALDIGWVGAAAPTARILDLAGITDPVVARLPGGHTTKRISEGLVENRGVDTLVLLLAPRAHTQTPWTDSIFARAVENRLASFPALEGFELVAALPLGGTEQAYALLRRPSGR